MSAKSVVAQWRSGSGPSRPSPSSVSTPPISKASNTLIPGAGEDQHAGGPRRCRTHLEVLRRHLEDHVPWGAHVTVGRRRRAAGVRDRRDRSGHDAARAAFRRTWGVDRSTWAWAGPSRFIAEFAATFPDATILVTGVEGALEHRRTASTKTLDLGVLEGLRSPRARCSLVSATDRHPAERRCGSRRPSLAPWGVTFRPSARGWPASRRAVLKAPS